MIPGIDVSNWNGFVDWNQVAGAGVQFAFAKASEGTSYSDPFFPRNWGEMKRVGLVRGAYHFARPDLNEPEAEAAFFLRHIPSLEPGDILVVDMEVGQGNLLSWTARFLTAVQAVTGFRPMIYSGDWFMAPHGLEDASLGSYGLWIAAYQSTPPPPPAGWSLWAIWQHSATGSVPGIVGAVDLNWFAGTREQMLLYGKPVPAPKPKPRIPTNDDLVAAGKLLLAADIASTLSYLAPFAPTGTADAVEPDAPAPADSPDAPSPTPPADSPSA